MPQSQDRLHALESQFDLPAPAIVLGDVGSRVSRWQTGPDQEIARHSEALGRYALLVLAGLLLDAPLLATGSGRAAPQCYQPAGKCLPWSGLHRRGQIQMLSDLQPTHCAEHFQTLVFGGV